MRTSELLSTSKKKCKTGCRRSHYIAWRLCAWVFIIWQSSGGIRGHFKGSKRRQTTFVDYDVFMPQDLGSFQTDLAQAPIKLRFSEKNSSFVPVRASQKRNFFRLTHVFQLAWKSAIFACGYILWSYGANDVKRLIPNMCRKNLKNLQRRIVSWDIERHLIFPMNTASVAVCTFNTVHYL